MNIKQTLSGGNWIATEELKGSKKLIKIGEFGYQEFEKKDDEGNPTGEKEITYYVTAQNVDNRRLRLNATNRQTVGELLGGETDNWGGKWVKVGTAKVRFGAKLVDGVVVDSILPSDSEINAAETEIPV